MALTPLDILQSKGYVSATTRKMMKEDAIEWKTVLRKDA